MGLNLQMRETRMMGWMNQQRMNKDTDELTGEKKDINILQQDHESGEERQQLPAL